MHLTTLYTAYLIIFRLSIIVAGIISIYLGYRLFCRGIYDENSTGKSSDITAQLANSKFSIKNAAPGTTFALFGITIICIMFIKGSPEMTLKQMQSINSSNYNSTEIIMRGEQDKNLLLYNERGKTFVAKKEYHDAILEYEKALNLLSEPMNALAWLYLKSGKINEALPISKLACSLSPTNANYLDTLAEINIKEGRFEEAKMLLEKAAIYDPRFRGKYDKLNTNTKSDQ